MSIFLAAFLQPALYSYKSAKYPARGGVTSPQKRFILGVQNTTVVTVYVVGHRKSVEVNAISKWVGLAFRFREPKCRGIRGGRYRQSQKNPFVRVAICRLISVYEI